MGVLCITNIVASIRVFMMGVRITLNSSTNVVQRIARAFKTIAMTFVPKMVAQGNAGVVKEVVKEVKVVVQEAKAAKVAVQEAKAVKAVKAVKVAVQEAKAVKAVKVAVQEAKAVKVATATTPLNSVVRLLSPSLGVGSTTVTTRPVRTSVRHRGLSAPTAVVRSALMGTAVTLPNRLRKL